MKPISGVADEDGVEQNDEEAKGDASTEIGLENDEPDPRFQVQEGMFYYPSILLW